MTDYERIIKGHECCKNGFCLFCPYDDGKEETNSCKCHLADETIAVLLSRTPRLLTVEEINALEPGNTFWIESRFVETPGEKPITNIEMAVVAPDRSIHLYSTWFFSGDFTLSNNAMLQERAWSVKPTDEQRSAEPWPVAERKPEPVYPTWTEYFRMIGLFPEWSGHEILDNTPIPADLANLLGVEPKEVQNGTDQS